MALIDDGQMHHLAMIHDGTDTRVYIDGAQVVEPVDATTEED